MGRFGTHIPGMRKRIYSSWTSRSYLPIVTSVNLRWQVAPASVLDSLTLITAKRLKPQRMRQRTYMLLFPSSLTRSHNFLEGRCIFLANHTGYTIFQNPLIIGFEVSSRAGTFQCSPAKYMTRTGSLPKKDDQSLTSKVSSSAMVLRIYPRQLYLMTLTSVLGLIPPTEVYTKVAMK